MKYLLTAAIAVIMLTAGNRPGNADIQLVQPKGWPKPVYTPHNDAKASAEFALGRKLFYEPMLSADGATSCGSCHQQRYAFADAGNKVSTGAHGIKGKRNTPGLFNLAWNTSFMHDGGVNNLEVQPLAPMTGTEMGLPLKDAINKLNTHSTYRQQFAVVYGDSMVTGQHVLQSLARFMAMLQSCNSKYDRYVRQETQLTEQEKKGLTLFRANCGSCHGEPLFTDNSLRSAGLPVDTRTPDYGRYTITRNPGDSLLFRVPTLRNVALTAPYMHDGRFATLNETLNHGSNKNLARQERSQLIAFLNTLTDSSFIANPSFGRH